MKDQVTSIEQSKRLIEVGVPVERASIVWTRCGNWHLSVLPHYTAEKECIESGRSIPAFTVADLLELLPMFIEQDDTYYLNISKCYEGWYVRYETEKDSLLLHFRGVELVDVLTETIDRLLTDGYRLNV